MLVTGPGFHIFWASTLLVLVSQSDFSAVTSDRVLSYCEEVGGRRMVELGGEFPSPFSAYRSTWNLCKKGWDSGGSFSTYVSMARQHKSHPGWYIRQGIYPTQSLSYLPSSTRDKSIRTRTKPNQPRGPSNLALVPYTVPPSQH